MGGEEVSEEETFESHNGVAECGGMKLRQAAGKEGHWMGFTVKTLSVATLLMCGLEDRRQGFHFSWQSGAKCEIRVYE